MDMLNALTLAKEAGFQIAEPMDPKKLEFLPAVHDMCKACKQYGTKWVCPPGCGSLEEMSARYHRFQNGVLFQTVWDMEDDFDMEGMMRGAEEHKSATAKLLETLAELDEEVLPFGNDGCGRCAECTYPESPCRFPDKAYPSLEAVGIMVGDACKANNVTYYYGRNKVALTGAFLFNPEDSKEASL